MRKNNQKKLGGVIKVQQKTTKKKSYSIKKSKFKEYQLLTMKNNKKSFKEKHDNILFYNKSSNYLFNSDDIKIEHTEATKKRYKRAKSGFTQGELKLTGKIPNDVWDDCYLVNNQFTRESVGYATQKPKKLIERIIKASSNEGDLVADFYGGSFTTAEVCKDLNRNFIGCDISKKAVAIGLERTKY